MALSKEERKQRTFLNAIVFLASEDAPFVSGQTISGDGGRSFISTDVKFHSLKCIDQLNIDRLIKKGFFEERTDEQDKRSKQVSLTKKGKNTLEKCDAALSKVAESLYGDMPEEELKFCVQYLSPIEISIAQKWNKIKRFEPVFE